MFRFFSSLLFSSSAYAYAETYTILISEPKSEPFHFMDKNGKVAGFEVDLLTEIANRSDIKWNIKISSNFLDSMEKVRKGEVDAFIDSVSITDDRKKVFNFTDAYIDSHPVFIISKDPNIKTIADLKDKIVVVNRGTSHEKLIREIKGENDESILLRNSPFLSLQAVIQGKAEATLSDELILYTSFVRYQKYGLVGVVDTNYTKDQYGILLNKGKPELKTKIDVSLNAMKADGTLKTLTKEYFRTNKGLM